MIHPTSLISSSVILGKNVDIGPYCIIHDGVIIGDNSKIEAYCEVGYSTSLAKKNSLLIGKNSLIRSHSVIYKGSNFDEGLQTGHRVTIRENTSIGKDCRIGTSCDIQGDVKIGNHVRMHSNVFVAKDAFIGNFAWLFPYVVLTNDPHPPSDISLGVIIEEYAAIGARSTILPGVNIGSHSLVAAHSCVTKNVPSRMMVRGVPAKIVSEAASIRLKSNNNCAAYPWPKHFHRGYSAEVIEAWSNDYA